MAAPLFAPPRLRSDPAGSARHATWLETFYDLVFAVAVGALGARLEADLTWPGALRFVALFVPIWWAWLGHTVYDTRFDTDDLPQRLLTFAIMLAAAAMAAQVPRAFEGASAGFAVAYVGTRAGLLLLYLRARRHVPAARAIVDLYLAGFGSGAALWAMSVLAPPPARYALWATGLAVDLATPWVGRPRLRRAPVDTMHLPERLALFTIIVLGETMTVLVAHVPAARVAVAALVAALLAFVIAACIWWVYFTFVDVAPFVAQLGSGQPYMYLHLPIVVGLTLNGVGLGQAIATAGHPVLSPAARLLLGSGVLLWLGAALGLKAVSVGHSLTRVVYARYAGFGAAIALLTLPAAPLPPVGVLGGLAFTLGLFAALDVRHWSTWARDHETDTLR